MSDEMRPHVEPDNPEVHHEESDINVRAVLIGAAIFGVFSVIMSVGLWGMYVGFRAIDRKLDPPAPTRIEEAPSAARDDDFRSHWSEPAKYLEVVREDDRKILEEYGWTDRSTGTVHVPIEVGMKMALDRGYPTRQDPDAPIIGGGEHEPVAPWGNQDTRSEPESMPQTSPGATTGEDPDQTGAEDSREAAPAGDPS